MLRFAKPEFPWCRCNITISKLVSHQKLHHESFSPHDCHIPSCMHSDPGYIGRLQHDPSQAGSLVHLPGQQDQWSKTLELKNLQPKCPISWFYKYTIAPKMTFHVTRKLP